MADQPLHLSSQLKNLPAHSFLLQFTDEDLALQKQLIAHYRALLQGKTPAPVNVRGTLGRFAEGVL